MNVGCKAVDMLGNYHFLAADTEEELEQHCARKDELAIVNYAYNITPIMVSHHFTWVGKRRNPFVISKRKHSDYEGVK